MNNPKDKFLFYENNIYWPIVLVHSMQCIHKQVYYNFYKVYEKRVTCLSKSSKKTLTATSRGKMYFNV